MGRFYLGEEHRVKGIPRLPRIEWISTIPRFSLKKIQHKNWKRSSHALKQANNKKTKEKEQRFIPLKLWSVQVDLFVSRGTQNSSSQKRNWATNKTTNNTADGSELFEASLLFPPLLHRDRIRRKTTQSKQQTVHWDLLHSLYFPNTCFLREKKREESSGGHGKIRCIQKQELSTREPGGFQLHGSW